MNTNNILDILKQLDNQSLQSNTLKWQLQEISSAQPLTVNTNPSYAELVKYAKGLSAICRDGDLDKAEFFCFLPVSREKWRVFVLDRFCGVLAQLENFEDVIYYGGNPYREAFLLKIS